MAKSDKASLDVFDLDRIRSLIDLMKEHGLNEIDLRQAEQQIRLSRGGGVAVPAMMPAPVAVPAVSAGPVASAAKTVAAEAADEKNIAFIKSPMVGTFYSKPNPNAAPFVKVGDHIDSQTTVCIIEAMKVFNEIPAEIKGRVLAVLADDESPVDFGKPLFKIDTSR